MGSFMWHFLLSHFCLAALTHESLYLSACVQTIVLDSVSLETVQFHVFLQTKNLRSRDVKRDGQGHMAGQR